MFNETEKLKAIWLEIHRVGKQDSHILFKNYLDELFKIEDISALRMILDALINIQKFDLQNIEATRGIYFFKFKQKIENKLGQPLN